MREPKGRSSHRVIQVENLRRSQTLVSKGWGADTSWTSLRGSIGRRPLPEAEGLPIVPCSSIHTHFMSFPIDVLYVGSDQRVVGIDQDMKPWWFGKPRGGARFVVQLPAGAIAATGTQVGDVSALEVSEL